MPKRSIEEVFESYTDLVVCEQAVSQLVAEGELSQSDVNYLAAYALATSGYIQECGAANADLPESWLKEVAEKFGDRLWQNFYLANADEEPTDRSEDGRNEYVPW